MTFPTPYPDYQFSWDIRVYDLDGVELAQVTEATNRMLSFPLNGLDSFSCGIYLDDPLIDPNQGGDPTIIRTVDRTMKVWRTVTDVTNPLFPVVLYQDDPGTPSFAGYITRVNKTGSDDIAEVVAQSPLWRLQTRFHLLNHYLVIDWLGNSNGPPTPHQGGNEDDLPWDISALMFKLIDLVQGAFGGASYNGILKPTGSAPFWPKTLEMGPFMIHKGDNTWTLFSTLLDQVGGPDLTPEYIHVPNQPDLMYFKTAEHRGIDISTNISFDYYTGRYNLDDIGELEEILPDKFANFVWCVGQGGPNVTLALAEDAADTDMGYQNVGVYMHLLDNESLAVGAGSVTQDNADAELTKTDVRPSTYTIMVSPLTLIYGVDFNLGDIARVNANKGALQIVDKKQRLYEITVSMSDNNEESYDLTVADDFFSKIPLD